ncbi:MAG: beta-galactosidase [Phycisphaerae bacterium]|nr:beta-galactosidase [Phycisphaerae bacterium]
MRNYRFILIVLCISAFTTAAAARELWQFIPGNQTGDITATDATYSIADGAMAIKTGNQKDWPGVTLHVKGDNWDLSKFRYVKLDVQNTSSKILTLAMRIDDPQGNGSKHSRTQSIDIPVGKTAVLDVPLNDSPWVLDKPLELVGMRGNPTANENFDTKQICRVYIFLNKPNDKFSFKISNLRAAGEVQFLDSKTFIPFVDEFGQFIHCDWPGKIKSEAGLFKAKQSEAMEMAIQPSPGKWNKYGGWLAGPKLTASGYFRVQKVKGQWWLVDPDGYLFWSHGVDCVGTGAASPISDRENYFKWLPDQKGKFADCYSTGSWAPHGYYAGKGKYRTFDFSQSNLKRKYGDDYFDDYALLCHQRLRSWGMNTIANWSDARIYLKKKTPYTATLHFTSKVIEGSQGYWGKFYDVFDPEFRSALKQRIAREKAKTIDDPWCIGFYVHNELGWGDDTSLALAALLSPKDQAAKKKFMAVLQEKYIDIDKLNKVWGSDYASWDALLESQARPDLAKSREDLNDFYRQVAEQYFKIIKEELKLAAPNQLYLGCRFAWVNDTAAIAAAKYCDIISYNRYKRTVSDLRLPDNIDKPLIIGEFHFGTLDRGMFHTGLVPCKDQDDRADHYRNYVYGALRNPDIVGTGWFQFRSQALTGRGDGENYQIGLLDICDSPYPETIKAVRDIGYDLYNYRYNVRQVEPADNLHKGH